MRQFICDQTIPDMPTRFATAPTNGHCHLRRTGWLALIALTLTLLQAPADASEKPRQLDFYHTHTKKNLSVVYHDGDNYIPAALEQINNFLSDFRNGAVHTIDPATLDILFKLRTHFGGTGTYEIISAYRSPETNAMLRARGRSVARKSLHMEGQAIDARLRGVDTVRLRDAALQLKLGGVGYYRESDFVHVDNGRVRTW